MPKCPYCSEELRLKLSVQGISEVDPDYYIIINSYVESLPKLLRRIYKSQLERMQEHIPLVELIVCAYCDTLLNAKMQITTSRI